MHPNNPFSNKYLFYSKNVSNDEDDATVEFETTNQLSFFFFSYVNINNFEN